MLFDFALPVAAFLATLFSIFLPSGALLLGRPRVGRLRFGLLLQGRERPVRWTYDADEPVRAQPSR